MNEKWNIYADHPILPRIDNLYLSTDEKDGLVELLKELNYDNLKLEKIK
jgi:hypothetical protein